MEDLKAALSRWGSQEVPGPEAVQHEEYKMEVHPVGMENDVRSASPKGNREESRIDDSLHRPRSEVVEAEDTADLADSPFFAGGGGKALELEDCDIAGRREISNR
ncbi:UNVERIFIED_CONTAM: hypothetical protein K2H54_000704 [Gekko kuhli]